jgi:hypothetical protein
MVVMGYLMGRKIKQYSNKPIIANGVVFFLNHLGEKCCQKQGAMVGPCISFVALGWIDIGQNGSL